MPPGAHAINASQGGQPVSLAVNVSAEGATNAQKAFDSIMEAARAGEEDKPYIDLNHEDREAAGWPSGFFWAGEDPVNGGIRMRLDWSAAGKAAILGKTFRRFSPSFYVDQNGIVIGAPVNMGGLVNRAAFKRIQPVWSKDASASADPADKKPTEETEPTMKSLLSVLASQGLLKSADVDEGTAVAQVTAALSERATKSSATEAELTETKAKLGTTETKYNTLVEAHATSVVDAAIQAGRIPGQNAELKAKWVGLIKADPTNASLLPEPNEALKRVVQASGPSAAQNGAAQGGEHQFLVKAKALQGEKKISLEGAMAEVAQTDAALYDSYRESLGN